MIGGVLLKIQDKFRVGDNITIKKGDEGCVVEISYLTTTIRRSDDSFVAIPNHIFAQSELINWSRTPYRKFVTTTTIPTSMSTKLPEIINSIKNKLSELPEIETSNRNLLVSATNFDGGKITIKIDAHLIVSNDKEESLIHTKVIGLIASSCT